MAEAEPGQGAVWTQWEVAPDYHALRVRAHRLLFHVVHNESKMLAVLRWSGAVVHDRKVRAFAGHGDHGACGRALHVHTTKAEGQQ